MFYLQFGNHQYKSNRIVAFIGNDPPMEPIETQRKVRPLLVDSSEYKKQQELIAEKVKLYKEQKNVYLQYVQKFNSATKKYMGPQDEGVQLQADYQKKTEEIGQLEQLLSENAELLESRLRDLRTHNAVYSAPRNSILITDEKANEWSKLLANLTRDELLLEDGTKISKKEFEVERISKLSEPAKRIELDRRLHDAMSAAVNMRNQMEIQGDSEALKKSQEWFASEKQRIEEWYTG